jgi:dihydrolipoamide dehydrogenase
MQLYMEDMDSKKLVIIGAGPGGYSAAFLAADMGMQVTLVDSQEEAGGVCLHRGCIPSKALLHLAKLIRETRDAESCGLSFGVPEIDLQTMAIWKNRMIKNMSAGLSALAKKRGVKRVTGHAVFNDEQSLRLSDGAVIDFDRCLIATGSRPQLPKIFKGLGPGIWDSTLALEIKEIPKRLLVVGGGYIGLELGTAYQALGSEVTVVEMEDRLLTGVDSDLVRPLMKRLQEQFHAIHLNTRVMGVSPEDGKLRVQVTGEGVIDDPVFDRVLVAVGRKPNSDALELQNTSVTLDTGGFVVTNETMQTMAPSIWAIGDVTTGPMLAHKATHEGRTVIENMLGDSSGEKTPRAMPAVVFTDPEIAWCGITEEQARAQGKSVTVARFPWEASGRAQTLGRPEGVTKLILQAGTDRVLGVGIVGSGAGELIAEGALAVAQGLSVGDLAALVHPHPTLSETVMEAAQSHYGTATHINKPRRP